MTKMVVEKVESIKKEGKAIRDHLKSRESIMKNDEAIYFSTFSKEIVHYQTLIEKEKEVVLKKFK